MKMTAVYLKLKEAFIFLSSTFASCSLGILVPHLIAKADPFQRGIRTEQIPFLLFLYLSVKSERSKKEEKIKSSNKTSIFPKLPNFCVELHRRYLCDLSMSPFPYYGRFKSFSFNSYLMYTYSVLHMNTLNVFLLFLPFFSSLFYFCLHFSFRRHYKREKQCSNTA